MTRLPSYLLKSADLPRWQARAAEEGVSFASYVRDALDAYAAAPPDAPVRARTAKAPAVRSVPTAPKRDDDLGRRDVTPRFKGTK